MESRITPSGILPHDISNPERVTEIIVENRPLMGDVQ